MIVNSRPNIAENIDAQFRQLAMATYPNEAVAFVINGKLVPVLNTHDDPENFFALSARDGMLMFKAEAFLHSHPNGPCAPSAADMSVQIACKVPFGVCECTETTSSSIEWWGDFILDKPLLERPFIHGIFDCYALLRAVYWQELNIKVPDAPRNYEWWANEPSLFIKNLGQSKFSEVTDLKKYDVLLMNYGSDVINHCAISLGNDEIYHHLGGKYSCKDNVTKYAKRIRMIVRYND